MNHGNAIKFRDVIRFRNGAHALMKVDRLDTLCGYVTYQGVHLYGERISVCGNQCRPATKEEIKIWDEHRGERRSYALNLNMAEELEWAC